MRVGTPRAVLLLTLVLAPTATSRADDIHTGNYLLRACKELLKDAAPQSPEELVQRYTGMYCTGFVAGIVDMNAMYQGLVLKSDKAGFFCLPPSGVENEQMIRIIVKYLESNPEILHESARSSVVVALGTVFPCNAK